MDIRLASVTEENFWDVVQMKSEKEQVEKFQLFERWVGSNAFFIAFASVKGLVNRVIYDGDDMIGFSTYGYDREKSRYEMVSIMIRYEKQGNGYGTAALRAVVDEMIAAYPDCVEIYLSVMPGNAAGVKTYTKAGFQPTGDTSLGFVAEDVYRLDVVRVQ